VKSLITIALLGCALTGCNRAVQDKEAIRQGVIDYVSSKVNVGAMEVDVTSVSFKGQEAEAGVVFRAKGVTSGPGMQMRYTLEQKSGKWVVKDKAETGATPHGAAAPKGGGELPQGGGELPQGHPSLGAGEKK
jgi:hypothetical protein